MYCTKFEKFIRMNAKKQPECIFRCFRVSDTMQWAETLMGWFVYMLEHAWLCTVHVHGWCVHIHAWLCTCLIVYMLVRVHACLCTCLFVYMLVCVLAWLCTCLIIGCIYRYCKRIVLLTISYTDLIQQLNTSALFTFSDIYLGNLNRPGFSPNLVVKGTKC